MGGGLDITVAADTTEIATDVLSEFAPQAVALVADVAQNPRFPEAELARLKADKLRELSIASSNPQQIALEKFRAVLYAGHAYGRVFPTEAQLSGYTLAQVRDFYAKNFGAARSHLYVVGRFEPAQVEKAVRDAFSGWAAGPAPAATPAQPKSTRGVHLVDRPGAVQSTLIVGMPVIDPTQPDYVPLVVTNTLLGGYFSSRLTANLREQKGYTYSPFSQLSSRRRDAYWAENADVTTAVTGPSLKEIFYEIDRLQAEPPSRGGAPDGEELRRGHLRAEQLHPRRDHRPAGVRGPPRPARDVPPRLRGEGQRGDAGRRSSRWRRSTSRTTRPRSWSSATARSSRSRSSRSVR